MNGRMAHALDFPADVVFDMPVIRLEGKSFLRCENHKGLLEYSDSCIRFAAKDMTVRITGSKLVIEEFCGGDMSVSGTITSIELLPSRAHRA